MRTAFYIFILFLTTICLSVCAVLLRIALGCAYPSIIEPIIEFYIGAQKEINAS